MTIIIEDGTVVAGANSYASVADLDAYAALRGMILPTTAAEKEVLLIKAMDYIETRGWRYQGARYHIDQTLAWPRYGVRLNGFHQLYSTIPTLLIEAQCDVAANSVGIDVLPLQLVSAQGAVTQESVGSVSVSYATPDGNERTLPRFPKADALLDQLRWHGPGAIRVRKA